MTELRTTDLCDAHPDSVRVATPLLRDFGGRGAFHGRVVTLRVHEDNVLVRRRLESDGRGCVLVVDGGGSTRCALLGDRLARLACDNGWTGIVIHGCVRDSAELAHIPIGIKALYAVPRKSGKQGTGETDVALSFAGVHIAPGDYLYADPDGIVIAAHELRLP